MLSRKHMEELKEFTNEVLYENYRAMKLANKGDDYMAPSDMK
jgi:septin family protein